MPGYAIPASVGEVPRKGVSSREGDADSGPTRGEPDKEEGRREEPADKARAPFSSSWLLGRFPPLISANAVVGAGMGIGTETADDEEEEAEEEGEEAEDETMGESAEEEDDTITGADNELSDGRREGEEAGDETDGRDGDTATIDDEEEEDVTVTAKPPF